MLCFQYNEWFKSGITKWGIFSAKSGYFYYAIHNCQMDELREDSEQEEYFETDRRLHGMILKYCGNRRLIEVWNRLNMQIERIRVLSAGKPERLLQSRKEHMNVVEAMIGRDIAKAEFLLAEHIDHVRDSVLEVSKYIS